MGSTLTESLHRKAQRKVKSLTPHSQTTDRGSSTTLKKHMPASTNESLNCIIALLGLKKGKVVLKIVFCAALVNIVRC